MRPPAPHAPGSPAPLLTSDLLSLQRTLGNRATRSLLASAGPSPAPARPARAPAAAIVQRALNPLEQNQLTQRIQLLRPSVIQLIGSVPQLFLNQYAQDPWLIFTIDATRNQLNAPAAVFATLNGQLDEVEQLASAWASEARKLLPLFEEVRDLYAGYSADFTADETSLLSSVSAKLFATKNPNFGVIQRDLIKLKNLVKEKVLSSKELLQLVGKNKDSARQAFEKMWNANIVGIDNSEAQYASSYDYAEDHFGASWKLTHPLQDWVMHAHCVANRDGNGLVASMTLDKAHLKHKSAEKALGESIDIQNQGIKQAFQQHKLDKFVRWANSNRGAGILAKSKRS